MLNSCKATLKKTSVSGPAGGRNFLSSNFFFGGGGRKMLSIFEFFVFAKMKKNTHSLLF